MADLSKYSDENIIDVLSSDAEAELRGRGYDYGWFKKDVFVGSIYILVNPAFPKLVKIGYADDVEKRMKQLSNSSALPDKYHCYAIYKVRKRLEDLQLHKLLDILNPDLRYNQSREFFELDFEKAFSILSAIAQINGDDEQVIKNPFNDDFFATFKSNVSTVKNNVNISSDISSNNGKSSDSFWSNPTKVKTDMLKIPNGLYYVNENWKKHGHITATMRVFNGSFIVLKGSMCLPSKANWLPTPRRNAKIVNGILQSDVECKSPSTAIFVVLGQSYSAWNIWKDSSGNPIDIYRK